MFSIFSKNSTSGASNHSRLKYFNHSKNDNFSIYYNNNFFVTNQTPSKFKLRLNVLDQDFITYQNIISEMIATKGNDCICQYKCILFSASMLDRFVDDLEKLADILQDVFSLLKTFKITNKTTITICQDLIEQIQYTGIKTQLSRQLKTLSRNEFKEIITNEIASTREKIYSYNRFKNHTQWTIYLTKNIENSRALKIFCQEIEEELHKLGIKPPHGCADSDVMVGEYFSMRQDRDAKGLYLNSSEDEYKNNLLKYQNEVYKSDIYKNLSHNLRVCSEVRRLPLSIKLDIAAIKLRIKELYFTIGNEKQAQELESLLEKQIERVITYNNKNLPLTAKTFFPLELQRLLNLKNDIPPAPKQSKLSSS